MSLALTPFTMRRLDSAFADAASFRAYAIVAFSARVVTPNVTMALSGSTSMLDEPVDWMLLVVGQHVCWIEIFWAVAVAMIVSAPATNSGVIETGAIVPVESDNAVNHLFKLLECVRAYKILLLSPGIDGDESLHVGMALFENSDVCANVHARV